MHILVVGGAGYVGSILVPHLINHGHLVTVFDRGYFGFEGLTAVRHAVKIIRGDMRCLPDGLLDGVGAVINIGGLSNDPTAEFNPEANYQMNTEAAVALAKSCLQHGISKYIYASSASVYDGQGVERIWAEDVPLQMSIHPYTRSKQLAEAELLTMDGLEPVILRKATLYGASPRMRFDLVVNAMVRDAVTAGKISLYGGGAMWRPLVHVRDVAEAYRLATRHTGRGVYNIVGENCRISEVGLRIAGALPAKYRVDLTCPPASGIRDYRMSGEKASRELGFEASYTIEGAVPELIEAVENSKPTPRTANIQWMNTLEEARAILGSERSVYDVPA